MNRQGTILFRRTMLLLSIAQGVVVFGSYLTRGTQFEWTTSWVFALLGMVGTILWAASAVDDDDISGVIPVLAFAFFEGLLLGPVVSVYAENLGSNTVFMVFLGTLGLTAVLGSLGSVLTLPFNKMGGFLSIALFGLVVYLVVTIFNGIPSRTIDFGFSIVGMLVFMGLIVVDFARIKDAGSRGNRGWGLAGWMAMNILLDEINIFLFALRALVDDD